jgi:hypothetical protein
MALGLLYQFVLRGLMHQPIGDEIGSSVTEVPPMLDAVRWTAAVCLGIGIVLLVWDGVRWAKQWKE